MSQWSELTTLTKLKYIGHWLASDDLSNDDDTVMQCRQCALTSEAMVLFKKTTKGEQAFHRVPRQEV